MLRDKLFNFDPALSHSVHQTISLHKSALNDFLLIRRNWYFFILLFVYIHYYGFLKPFTVLVVCSCCDLNIKY